MTQFSRSKKNKDLYEQLQSDSESQIQSTQLSDYANRLNQIDSNTFEKMDVKKEEYQATRVKEPTTGYTQTQATTTSNADYTYGGAATKSAYEKEEEAKIEKKLNDYVKENSNTVSSFNNEYLDEFINEVKSYNIEKGLRTTEDTQMNILNELRSANTVRVFGDNVEPKQKVTQTQSTSSYPSQQSSQIHADIEETKKSITSEIQKLMQTDSSHGDDLSQLTNELNQWEQQHTVAEEVENSLEKQKESILESFLSSSTAYSEPVYQEEVAPVLTEQPIQQQFTQQYAEPEQTQQTYPTYNDYAPIEEPEEYEPVQQTVSQQQTYNQYSAPVEPVVQQNATFDLEDEDEYEDHIDDYNAGQYNEVSDDDFMDYEDDDLEAAYVPQEPVYQSREEQLSATTSFKKHSDMEYLAAMEEDRIKRQEAYFEETAQIKTQMVEYEDELDMVNKKVSNVNKLLNVFLVILIIALIGIIAFAVYTLLMSS